MIGSVELDLLRNADFPISFISLIVCTTIRFIQLSVIIMLWLICALSMRGGEGSDPQPNTWPTLPTALKTLQWGVQAIYLQTLPQLWRSFNWCPLVSFEKPEALLCVDVFSQLFLPFLLPALCSITSQVCLWTRSCNRFLKSLCLLVDFIQMVSTGFLQSRTALLGDILGPL